MFHVALKTAIYLAQIYRWLEGVAAIPSKACDATMAIMSRLADVLFPTCLQLGKGPFPAMRGRERAIADECRIIPLVCVCVPPSGVEVFRL